MMTGNYKYVYIKLKGKFRRLLTYNNQDIRVEHIKVKKYLEDNIYPSKFAKAYIKNSSIYLNAKAHMYNDIFIKFDIKKFFDNINHKILLERVYIELDKLDIKYNKVVVADMISLCLPFDKGLPLGLITSPTLANIYLKEFDGILYGKLKLLGLINPIYTRYADDMTISFKIGNLNDDEVRSIQSEIETQISKLLKRYKLKLNIEKTSLINLKYSNHVRITGISIIKCERDYRKLSVGKKRISELFDLATEIHDKKIAGSEFLTTEDLYLIKRIKGMNSFVLSIHKTGYENMFSPKMKNKILELGYDSLNDLIKNL